MYYRENFKIQLKDILKNKYINDRGILEIFENIATHHSDLVGYGIDSIEDTRLSWVLLDWKIEVVKRPVYGNNLDVKTWVKKIDNVSRRMCSYREYEIYDENNQLLVRGEAKWVMVNIDTGRISIISDDVERTYEPEYESVFEKDELEKIKSGENYISSFNYCVKRRDVDFNQHMHNLYYLDLAYETMPEEVYDSNKVFNSIRITYKKEVKLYDNLVCKYAYNDDKHVVDIYNSDETKLHCMIRFK